MHILEVKVPLYKIPVNIAVYSNKDQLLNWISEECNDNTLDMRGSFDDYDGGFFNYNDTQFLLFDINGKLSPGIIAHECKHAVNDTFVQVSMNLDPYNDEGECYLLTWYVDKITEFIESVKKERSNL